MTKPGSLPRGGSAAGEARVLARVLAVAGAMGLFTAAVPFSPTAPVHLAAAAGVTSLLLGAALRAWSAHVSRPAVHLLLTTATVAMSFLVGSSTTPVGLVVTSYGYVWITVFAAWFHTPRAAALHAAMTGAGFAAALTVADAVAPVQTWVFVMTSVVTVTATLNGLVRRLRAVAERDQLTGLLNRTAFAAVAEHAMAQATRSGEPLTLALLDLDGFKQVNDGHGHAAGDRLLAHLASSWSGGLRGGDVLGRHGGDEFVLLMPDTSWTGAEAVLARLRDVTTEGRWSTGRAQWRGEDLDGWLAAADGDLYREKAARAAARAPAVS